MKKREFTTMVKTIDEDTCADIQTADLLYRTSISLMVTLLDRHLRDGGDNLTDSVVFEGLLAQAVEQFEDWDNLKMAMIDAVDIPDGMKIGSWDLRYDNGELTYNLVDATPAKKEIVIDEEICHAIQDAQARMIAIREVQSTMLEMYREDVTCLFLKSAQYKNLAKMAFAAESEFEAKKSEMIADVDVSDGANWNLTYVSRTLSIY